MEKKFPRIHSLSTVGIQHHYHADYKFHPFRTDFSGDSGVGKSMIADMLQLIFVGNEFMSATEGTDERPSKTMPFGRYGYVYINVEVEPLKFIGLGMFISTATINPDPFIIHGGYKKDEFIPLSNPIYSMDILNGEIIEDIDAVSKRLDGQCKCQRVTQKVYHEYLMDNELLPIQINDRNRLKNYARILRSFARGRDFKYDSESLKYFFFDDQIEKKILEDFQNRLDNIEADLVGHKRHKETLEIVTSKEDDLIKLKGLSEKKYAATLEFYKAKSVFHFRNVQEIKSDLSKNRLRIKEAIAQIVNFRVAKLKNEIQNIGAIYLEIEEYLSSVKKSEIKLKEIEESDRTQKVKLDEIASEAIKLNLIKKAEETEIIDQIEQLYRETRKVGDWINKYESIENVQDAFYSQLDNRKKQNLILKLESTLKKQSLMQEFLASKWVKEIDVEISYKEQINVIDTEIKRQEGLLKFADTKNPNSLSSWALKNNKVLSKEQESVLVYFKDLSMQKPDIEKEGAKYIPIPKLLFYNLEIEKKNNDGFWIKLNGIHEYIPYVKTRFFNTANLGKLEKYFSDNYNKASSELQRLKQGRKKIVALKSLLNQVGSETLKIYCEKEKIDSYVVDEDLNKTEEEFKSFCQHYFFADEIKRWKSEIDKHLITKAQSAQLKENIAIKLDNIATFLRRNKQEMNSNCKDLFNSLGMLRGVKEREKKSLEHHLCLYEKIFTPLDSEIIKNESNELAERKFAKQNVKKLEQKLQTEEEEYAKYLLKYENFSQEKLNIDLSALKNQYFNPNIEDSERNKISERFRLHYDDIVKKHVHPASRVRYANSEDFIALAKEILPEIFTRRIINNETAILRQIKEYLTEITEKYTEFSDVKLNILKEIFTDVRDESIEYLTEIAELSNYFSQNDCQISQGVRLRISHKLSDTYPMEWIETFINRLEEKATYSNLFESLGKKVSIEDMMKEAYVQCGGKKRKFEIKHLLNPKSYFNIDFSMRKEDGTKNSGSTGQTYAAIALLCIARLSLIEKKTKGKKVAKGLRIMPIDETENIGSNFGMLEKIAQDYDYQLVVISRHPLDDYGKKGRYQYMLNGQSDGDRIGTFAVFNEGEEAVEYIGPKSTLLENE